MKNIKMIFSTGLIMTGLVTVGVLNQQTRPPLQNDHVSVGSTITQAAVQPMKALEQLVQRYAEIHGHYPKSLQELNLDKDLQKRLAEIKHQNLENIGFLDAHLLFQSQVQDRHLLAGQFNEGLVLYQYLESDKYPSGYRITRSNRLGDILSRQGMPLSYSSWLQPGSYLNLSIQAHQNPIIVS